MTTTELPFPVDHLTLRAWLPPEPTGTGVTRVRHALGLVDAARSAVLAELAALDGEERETINGIAAAATAGEAPDYLLDHIKPAKRTALTHRLALLDSARTVLTHRLAEAERVDVDHVAWRNECERITEAWQLANSGGDTAEQRFANLVAFTELHRPS